MGVFFCWYFEHSIILCATDGKKYFMEIMIQKNSTKLLRRAFKMIMVNNWFIQIQIYFHWFSQYDYYRNMWENWIFPNFKHLIASAENCADWKNLKASSFSAFDSKSIQNLKLKTVNRSNFLNWTIERRPTFSILCRWDDGVSGYYCYSNGNWKGIMPLIRLYRYCHHFTILRFQYLFGHLDILFEMANWISLFYHSTIDLFTIHRASEYSKLRIGKWNANKNGPFFGVWVWVRYTNAVVTRNPLAQ